MKSAVLFLFIVITGLQLRSQEPYWEELCNNCDQKYRDLVVLSDGTLFYLNDYTFHKSNYNGIKYKSIWERAKVFYPEEFIVDGRDNIYGRKEGEVYLSRDKGEHWEKIADGMSNTAFAGLNGGGVIIANDTGVSVGKPDNYDWFRPELLKDKKIIKINVNKDGRIIVQTESLDFYQSTDGGSAWKKIPEAPGEDKMTMIMSDGDYIYGLADVREIELGIYRTSVNKISWERTGDLPDIMGDYKSTPVYKTYINSKGYIYLGTGSDISDGYYMSEDQGKTWKRVFNHIQNRVRDLFIDKFDDIYLTDHFGPLFYSDDDGKNLRIINQCLEEFEPGKNFDICTYGNNVYLATYGLFMSTDRGESWSYIYHDSIGSKTAYYSVDVNKNGIVTAGSDEGVLVIDVKNNTRKFIGKYKDAAKAKLSDNNKYLVLSDYLGFMDPGPYYISSDMGVTWSGLKVLPDPYDPKNSLKITDYVFNANGDLFAATYQGVYYTTDGGKNWIELNDGLYKNGNFVSLFNIIINENKNKIFAAGWDGFYIYDHVHSSRWENIATSLPGIDVRDEFSDMALDLYGGSGSNILLTEYGIFTDYNSYNYRDISGNIKGIKPDRMEDWSPTFETAINAYGDAFVILNKKIWRCRLNGSVSVDEKKYAFAGFDVFPNPVKAGEDVFIKNDGMSISRIKILDVSGITIKDINYSRQEPLCRVPAEGLAPGAYFVLIYSGDQVLNRRFIVY